MLDFRPVLFVLGVLLTTLAVTMVVPALADLAVGNPDWQVFAIAASVSVIVPCESFHAAFRTSSSAASY